VVIGELKRQRRLRCQVLFSWRPKVAGIIFPYVTAEEAARLLGLTSKTLANWRSNGDGPRFYRPSPKLVLYAVEDLNAWVERDGPRFTSAR
jgi:hypothetical protein